MTTPTTKSACIGINNAASHDKPSSYQRSCPLIPASFAVSERSSIHDHNYNIVDASCENNIIVEEGSPTSSCIYTTAKRLENVIRSCLVSKNDMPITTAAPAPAAPAPAGAGAAAAAAGAAYTDWGCADNYTGDEHHDPAIQIYSSDDAHLLRCRPTILTDEESNDSITQTILGINESHGVYQDKAYLLRNVPVRVSILEPCNNSIFDELSFEENACCCQHPRGSWERREESWNRDGYDEIVNNLTHAANLSIINFTKIQEKRRSSIEQRITSYPCIDTPGRVFHFLRSILNCNYHGGGLHCVSPWVNSNSDTCAHLCGASDHVVALLMNDPYNFHEERSICTSDFWDDLENGEIDELLQFRTGDAAPSYFLHSASRLSEDLVTKLIALSSPEPTEGICSSKTTLLLVYRNLPRRDTLHHRFLGQEMKHYKGCLVESYVEDTEDIDAVGMGEEPQARRTKIIKHRMVSPPYLSHEQEYPGILDSLLKNIDTIRNEARTIPQWTAWPEKGHYADNSWNVFPMCYTFPANDLAKRKFVDQTCNFVPETTKLLQTLGPVLRTALFSRLDAGSRLGAHTGWEDLANHVLRVHIPLIVPGSSMVNDGAYHNADNCNMGLCGVWVDGCVHTHEEGRIIVFDDSKVHRAFNYSDGERIVLIIDLARPQGLPMGTAIGGHSNELDDFISGF